MEALRKAPVTTSIEDAIETAPIASDPSSEVEELRRQLAEKEAQLAEAEQKVIRQRVLYEKAHEREMELQQIVDDREIEHTELIALREYVYSLRYDDLPAEEVDQAKLVADIQEKKVAVLGGHERWQKKMKRLFPGWVFVSVDDDSIGGFNALEGADYVFIYTNALLHKQYYRAMNLIRKQNKMLFYLGGTNISENILQMHKDLCR